jgi:hypothetical protein
MDSERESGNRYSIPFGFDPYVFGPPGSGSVIIPMVPSINKQKIWKKLDFYSFLTSLI